MHLSSAVSSLEICPDANGLHVPATMPLALAGLPALASAASFATRLAFSNCDTAPQT